MDYKVYNPQHRERSEIYTMFMKNDTSAKIDARATRTIKGKITIGVFDIVFKGETLGETLLNIPNNVRFLNKENKQICVDIENIIHKYHDLELTAENMKMLSVEVLKKGVELEYYV